MHNLAQFSSPWVLMCNNHFKYSSLYVQNVDGKEEQKTELETVMCI